MTQKGSLIAEISDRLAKARRYEDEIYSAALGRIAEYDAAAQAALDHMAELGFTLRSLRDAAAGFNELGVASAVFQSAVAAVRRLLFDDDRQLFRDVYCCGLREMHGYDSGECTEFSFQHGPSGLSFGIEIVLREPSYGFGRERGLLEPPPPMSGFRLVHPCSYFRSETVASGPDEEQMRVDVVAYAERGFKPDPSAAARREAYFDDDLPWERQAYSINFNERRSIWSGWRNG